MKNILVCLLTFVVIGSGVSTSYAGPYVSANLGALLVENADIQSNGFKGKIEFDPGYAFLVAVGSAVETVDRVSAQKGGRVESRDGGRVEVELGYRKSDIDKIKVNGFGSSSSNGDFSSLSLMANLYYDFATEGKFIPYIGAGVGGASLEADLGGSNSENDTVVAGQLIVGASFAASETLLVDMQYRYFATDNPEFDGLDAQYRTHNLMIGLRQSF